MSSASPNSNVSFSQFQGLFDAALKEYSRKTGKDIATEPLTTRLLRCDSSDAVLGILQEQAHAFNQFRNGDWKVQLMRRLKPTVDILLGLSTSGFFGEGIGLRFPPAKAIFAGVGLLLAAAKGVSTSYDALVELFECFERYLCRLKVITEIPSAVGEISVKIMVELLEVLALATQQIKQGRFKKLAKKLLGENDIEAVLQRLDRLTVEESRMTATQTMEVVYGLFNNMKVVMDDGKASIDNIRDALVTMQKISDDLSKMKCDQLQHNIQRWLSPPDPSINHNTACEAHHSGTATWFLEGLIYNEWKATGSLLWTHGNPGSGKSILCSSIINDIGSLRATGLASVAYYYFDFKDTGKQDRRGLLSSLLTQLCIRSHRGYDILSDLYKAHDNGSRQPSEVDLIRCLKAVLALHGRGRVYIIVDAVDECPNRPGIPSPREKVLQLLRELVDLHHPDLRICITSRPEVDIRTVLESLASHAVSLHGEEGQKKDIITYIESVVESDTNMRKWTPEDRQLVIDSLSQEANGMFRWIVCQLDTLRRCFPASIRRALNELPMTLDETYERILLGIDREKREHAIRLLKCLAFSYRPLRAKELAEVLAVQFDTGIPRLNTSFRPGDADEAVLSACSTLVTTVELIPDRDDYDFGDGDGDGDSDSDGYEYYKDYFAGFGYYDGDDLQFVQFSHYSVKEFLTSERLAKSDKRDLSQYYISPESAHIILAQSCISTLLRPEFYTRNIVDKFPLAKYAARYWFHHGRCDGVASQIQDGMERLFDPDRIHFATWISIHDIGDRRAWEITQKPEASLLYYATLCGIESLVEHLVTTRRQNPNATLARLDVKGTPLHVAATSGHTAIARLLLEHTADVNSMENFYGSTPLHDAARRGNPDIIRFLLNYGANVNSIDNYKASPLHMAAGSHSLGAVELLLKAGAYLETRNNREWTPLHEAASSGNLDIVRLLLNHRADVNVYDDEERTPRQMAAWKYFPDVVELLKNGVIIDVRNCIEGETPLHEAARTGTLTTVRLLLSRSADVNALNNEKNSPLGEAVRRKSPIARGVVRHLLKAGADANHVNLLGLTPLHEAASAYRANLHVIRLLLNYGADVNTGDYQEDSPLHRAVRSQELDAVELLLENSADVNIRNTSGSTPLHYAVESIWGRRIDVMKILLSHGADVNAIDNFGESPLHKALVQRSQERSYAMAQLLLGYGADVNARGRYHKTPIHLASFWGSLDVSRLLIEYGADIDVQDGECQTPFSIALENGHRKLAHFLSSDRVSEHDA